MSDQPTHVDIAVEAPADRVYAMLASVTRMGEWSPECVRCRWIGDVHEPEPGARFRGTSRNGWHRWSTVSTITVAEPGRAFEFAVSYFKRPVATWRYDLHEERGTTVVTESVRDQRGRVLRAVSPFITGSRQRDARNAETMNSTLANIKAAAEST
jgi:hypothetical protein